MTSDIAHSITPQPAPTASGPLFCALTGKPVSPEEAYWAAPLITTRELITTLVTTLFTAPANLGHLLLSEQPNVPYAPDARDLLAKRRSAEQAKLLGIILIIGALVFTPMLLLAIR